MMPQLDPRPVVQVDVEDDANRLLEIGVAFESLRGRKQDGFVRMLPEQTLYSPQHSGVIVDH
jgi:hypothetical protein